ncbi:uncharacterized protein LOC106181127 [Lingula anatina]|uniref:Uncharacterized protein LOC106181127 n=1 Tax=Lingula anatina TaxID=7574 RepID=A0A1S3KEJ6_LINAN|nr:uncharacterized protein LOC106181127 [Lingula anatina]|eukprot:XP_013420879.1 uncharacterized protein LOC106181127 [Lingula anatina]
MKLKNYFVFRISSRQQTDHYAIVYKASTLHERQLTTSLHSEQTYVTSQRISKQFQLSVASGFHLFYIISPLYLERDIDMCTSTVSTRCRTHYHAFYCPCGCGGIFRSKTKVSNTTLTTMASTLFTFAKNVLEKPTVRSRIPVAVNGCLRSTVRSHCPVVVIQRIHKPSRIPVATKALYGGGEGRNERGEIIVADPLWRMRGRRARKTPMPRSLLRSPWHPISYRHTSRSVADALEKTKLYGTAKLCSEFIHPSRTGRIMGSKSKKDMTKVAPSSKRRSAFTRFVLRIFGMG